MRYNTDPVRDLELEQRATAAVAWATSRDTFLSADAKETFRRKGWARFSVETKSAVNPMLSTDAGVAEAPLNAAFLETVDRQSMLGALDGALRVPLNAAALMQIGTVTASSVEEGATKPVGRMSFELDTSNPTKVVGEIVVSNEFLRTTNTATQRAVQRQLASATAIATDAALIDLLTDGSATATDIGALFAAISDGAPRSPFLIGGYDTLLPLADQLEGLRSLGIGILASAAAAGLLIALDASGLLIADGGVEIKIARHATVLLDDGGSPPGTTTVNLFQKNASAIRAERFFKIALRSGAVAWGAPS